MNSLDISIECLRSQLQQWIDLHLNKCIPVTILLLSHAFDLLNTNKQIENVAINEVTSKSMKHTRSVEQTAVVIQPIYLYINNEEENDKLYRSKVHSAQRIYLNPIASITYKRQEVHKH